jgi:hypothetical protein
MSHGGGARYAEDDDDISDDDRSREDEEVHYGGRDVVTVPIEAHRAIDLENPSYTKESYTIPKMPEEWSDSKYSPDDQNSIDRTRTIELDSQEYIEPVQQQSNQSLIVSPRSQIEEEAEDGRTISVLPSSLNNPHPLNNDEDEFNDELNGVLPTPSSLNNPPPAHHLNNVNNNVVDEFNDEPTNGFIPTPSSLNNPNAHPLKNVNNVNNDEDEFSDDNEDIGLNANSDSNTYNSSLFYLYFTEIEQLCDEYKDSLLPLKNGNDFVSAYNKIIDQILQVSDENETTTISQMYRNIIESKHLDQGNVMAIFDDFFIILSKKYQISLKLQKLALDEFVFNAFQNKIDTEYMIGGGDPDLSLLVLEMLADMEVMKETYIRLNKTLSWKKMHRNMVESEESNFIKKYADLFGRVFNYGEEGLIREIQMSGNKKYIGIFTFFTESISKKVSLVFERSANKAEIDTANYKEFRKKFGLAHPIVLPNVPTNRVHRG